MRILLYAPATGERADIASALTQLDHELLLASTAAEAAPALTRGAIDVIVLDLGSGPDGMRFLRKHAPQRGRAPIVCITDRRQPASAAEALRRGVADIVARPVRMDELLAAISNATELTLVGQINPDPPARDDYSGLFGASPAMREVLELVRRVAPSRCGILVAGERGSGREMIARAVHRNGTRRDQPFVKVVCADTTSGEMADLLAGRIEPGATVYLEEIGELTADGQARLEAALAPAAAADLRIVAGVRPQVDNWVQQGTLRAGLMQSIAVVRIDIPALRQRPDDIPLMALQFLKEACRANDVPAKTFSRSALALLSALPWPGNVSELRSLAERLAVLVPRGVVLIEDVLASILLDGAETLGRRRETLRTARERFERDYVTAVLQQHRGRMGDAARELGIERTNLYRKIRQLNIRWAAANPSEADN